MGKKKNVVVRGNTLRIEGETHVFAPEREQELHELRYGAHIADEKSDKAMMAIDTRAEVEAYAAELGVTLDSEVTDFLASNAMKFEPKESVDLSERLMEIDDPETDVFLEMLGIYANGSKREREELSELLTNSTYSFAQLAKIALSTVEGLGELEGGKLIHALSQNAPELIEAMLEAKVS